MGLFLNTTNKSIRVYTDSTATTTEPVYSTSYGDTDTTTFAATLVEGTDGSLIGSTPVTIITAPGSGKLRSIVEINITNVDTVSHIITVELRDSSTSYIIQSFVVPSGKLLYYNTTIGWQVGETGNGTVTSVALSMPSEFSVSGSPVTNFGTFTVSKANESANVVWAGPTTGAASQPTFRSLVNADMPSSGAGSGTVTSVAMTMPGVLFNTSVTGSPITSTGTLSPTLTTQTANTILSGPTTGAAATPTFRSLVSADIPSLSSIYLPLVGGIMTGAIVYPNGSESAPSSIWNSNYGWWWNSSASEFSLSLNGLRQASFSQSSATAVTFSVIGGSAADLNAWRVDTTANNAPNIITRKSSGTFTGVGTTYSFPGSGWALGRYIFQGSDGTNHVTGARIRGQTLEAMTTSAAGCRYTFDLAAIGAVSLTEVMRLEADTGLSMFGANVVVGPNRSLYLRVYTVGTLPAAGTKGRTAFVSDATVTTYASIVAGGGANNVPVFDDGTNWRIG